MKPGQDVHEGRRRSWSLRGATEKEELEKKRNSDGSSPFLFLRNGLLGVWSFYFKARGSRGHMERC